jgi:hypothetical protein
MSAKTSLGQMFFGKNQPERDHCQTFEKKGLRGTTGRFLVEIFFVKKHLT